MLKGIQWDGKTISTLNKYDEVDISEEREEEWIKKLEEWCLYALMYIADHKDEDIDPSIDDLLCEAFEDAEMMDKAYDSTSDEIEIYDGWMKGIYVYKHDDKYVAVPYMDCGMSFQINVIDAYRVYPHPKTIIVWENASDLEEFISW